MWIGHRKEIRKLTFRALALRRSESRNCGLCVVYTQKYGATLLVGAWQRKKQKNKLVEWKAFVDNGMIKSADLKNKFLFLSFAAFCASLMSGEASDFHMLLRMIRQIKASSDRYILKQWGNIHHKKLIWMISSLVTDANQARFFPELLGKIAKDIRSLISQSECALNAICFSIY